MLSVGAEIADMGGMKGACKATEIPPISGCAAVVHPVDTLPMDAIFEEYTYADICPVKKSYRYSIVSEYSGFGSVYLSAFKEFRIVTFKNF